MKQIKETTKEIEEVAYKNVEGFNFPDLCPKFIFELLNDNGVFVKAFNEVTSLVVKSKEQIDLKTFKYIIVKGEDENYYPAIDLMVTLTNSAKNYSADFCLTLTPFTASLDNAKKNAGVYGGCDEQLTKIWKTVMKGFFKEEWKSAYIKYWEIATEINNSKIATKAELEYLKNQQRFEKEINSIQRCGVKYNSYVRYLMEEIYGKKSNIYQCMMVGERISPMLKADIKKKGVKTYRIADKKKLLAEVKKCEEIFDKETEKEYNLGLN